MVIADMTRWTTNSWFFAAALALGALGCEAGGVGDPCIPEDEYQTAFGSFAVTEVNVESRSFQCETRVCLVNHFRGRVSCPYGQSDIDITTSPGEDPHRCVVPGTDGSNGADVIAVPVSPQLAGRRADRSVYCSCRCDGPDPNARYCECPSGYSCVDLVEDLQLGSGLAQLAGSYCIKDGTQFDKTDIDSESCVFDRDNCGEPRP